MTTDTGCYVGAEEVATLLGVPVGRVWAMTRAGRIPCLRLGRKTYRYQVEAVITALSKDKLPPHNIDEVKATKEGDGYATSTASDKG